MSTPENQSTETALAPTDLWSHVDHLFDDLTGSWFPAIGPFAPNETTGLLAARADVADRGDAYELRADVPGIPKEKIDLRVNGSRVQLSARIETTTEENGKSYLRRERTVQGFERAFELPEPIVEEKVAATYQDGVLTVTLPKAHPASERQIPIA
jgi:HSP20 family protein